MSAEADQKRVDTYVLATNAAGEPELLHFDLKVQQAQYDAGAHYDAAQVMAERAGYTPRGAFDQDDPAARRLSELADIQASASARRQTEKPLSSADNAPLVLFEAVVCSDNVDGPRFGSIRADETLRRRLLEMQALCERHGLSEVRVSAGCDWGPGDIEDEMRLQNHELVVVGDSFWFRADPKHADYHVETRAQDIQTFVDETRHYVGDAPLRYGEYSDAAWEAALNGLDEDELDDDEDDDNEPGGMTP